MRRRRTILADARAGIMARRNARDVAMRCDNAICIRCGCEEERYL